MINKKLIGSALFIASALPFTAFAAVQTVAPSTSSFTVASGSTVSFDVVYAGSSPQNVTGFGVQMYFDSTKLSFTGATNPFATGSAGAISASADGTDGDGDASTDQKVTAGWFDLGGNWPNGSGDTTLYTATFTATGDTTINFTGDAAAGHTFAATPVTVSLIVPDTTDPVVTAPADVNMEATGATTAATLGAGTATDDIDGALTPTPNSTGPFAVGAHTITWTATDAAGNSGTDTQTVTIADTTAPAITASDVTITARTADLPIAHAITATATDLVDGSVTPTVNNSGPFPAGATTVTWTATDTANNSSTADQTITVVVDDVPPVITESANGDVTTEAGATLTSDKNPSSLPPGEHEITWTATDAAGNTSTLVQNVVILTQANPSSIPTLSEWALILLTMMLALVSWVSAKRREDV